LWLIAATIVPSFLGWFLTPIFMVLFRSAIAPEIACFIGFWELAPFFEDSSNSASKCCLSKARLTKMRCGAYRPGCDFGRVFDHHFWVRGWTTFPGFMAASCAYIYFHVFVVSVYGLAEKSVDRSEMSQGFARRSPWTQVIFHYFIQAAISSSFWADFSAVFDLHFGPLF